MIETFIILSILGIGVKKWWDAVTKTDIMNDLSKKWYER